MAWRNIDIELWGLHPAGATAPSSAGMEAGGLSRTSRAPEKRVSSAAQQVVEAFRLIELEARRVERTVPTVDEREILAWTFRATVSELATMDRRAWALLSLRERRQRSLRARAPLDELRVPCARGLWLLRSALRKPRMAPEAGARQLLRTTSAVCFVTAPSSPEGPRSIDFRFRTPWT
jgi:hypothetical protein